MPNCRNYKKYYPRPAVLIIVGITILTLIAILSNNVFAQTLHNRTVYELVKQTSGSDEISEISVGDEPEGMALSGRYDVDIDSEGGILYVANYDSGTVSLISVENNTVIEEIPVQDGPTAIALGTTTDPVTGGEIERVYVASDLSDSVSVISIYENNSKTVENIPVDVRILEDYQDPIILGGSITDPATSGEMGIVYVIGIDGISLISVENNTVIEEIPVEAEALAPSLLEEKVYVGTNSSDIILAIPISLNNTEVHTPIEEIDVGHNGTTAIAVDSTRDPVTEQDIERVYVAHDLSDSVSVISIYENNSKTVENIPVQDKPTSIALDTTTDPVTGGEVERVYVANTGSDSVSVISIYENNTKTVENIPVQDEPTAIDHVFDTDVYVANTGSDSVSVISIYENNTKTVENIPVQDEPTAIALHGSFDAVYVANTGSDSVSVIDGSDKKVVAGVTFKVNPFNSGSILCDGLTTPSPIEQYMYVYSGAQCTAKPNEGFKFVSWDENLEDNSTQPISVWRPSLLDSFLESLGLGSDRPEATLNVTKFGTFTANFRELPPPIPPEYLLLFVSIFVTSIASLLTAWFGPRRKDK